MRVLVTGGAGFVGSHLCERLLNDGHEVLCLDNLQTGRLAHIAHLQGRPGFRFVEHDVTEPYVFPVERLYNLACPASPVHYQADPIKTTMTSVLGMVHALQLGERNGARVLQASTSEVYGDPEVHPQVESYRGCVNPMGPRSCYDEGKRVAETLCHDYHHRRGVAVRVVRIFNTYGPRMLADDGRVVSNFVVQALRGDDLTLYGDGSQTRSFCYVTDLVDGIVRMMEQDGDIGPVNLGNPGEFTVRELAELVLEQTGSPSGLVHRPLPTDDPTRRRPDIGKAKALLGWEPKVALRDGLGPTIGWFRAVLEGGRGAEGHG